MAPTAFEKAESEREVIKDNLNFLCTQLATNATAALTEAEVDTYLQQAATAKSDVMENHRQIRLTAPKTTDMLPYVATYNTILAQAIRIHSSFHGLKSKFPVTTTAATPSSSASAGASTTGPHQKIKLPPLELPKFGGNLQEWVTFRDLFVNAVHKSSLTNVEKLTQLKSLLTGEASRQVRSLLLSDANYDLAWQSLQDRYENNRELLFSIMRRLFQQPQVPPNSAIALRSLIDTTKECIRSLEVLAIQTDQWDAVLIYHLFNKIDATSRELWEQSLPDTKVPALAKMYDFLEQRARALAASSNQHRPPPKAQDVRVRTHHTSTAYGICKLGCTPGHPLFKCPQFQRNSPSQRLDVLKKFNLCHNCLQDGHLSATCTNKHTCKVCNRKHHTMVHLQDTGGSRHQSRDNTAVSTAQGTAPVTSHHIATPAALLPGILATAGVKVKTGFGEDEFSRSLVDGASTNSHITESAARRMKLPLLKCNIPMSGLQDSSVGIAKYITYFIVRPHFKTNSSAAFTVMALVVKSISSNIPSEPLSRHEWPHLENLQLADPEFEHPAPVEILLGADIFWNILEAGKVEGSPGQPLAIKSSLGWLVGGPNSTSTPVRVFTSNVILDISLRRFWEYEDIPESCTMSIEEKACEEHFQSTHRRNTDGTFVVSIPWKSPRPILGESRQMAYRRFISMERKVAQLTHSGEQLKFTQQHWDEYKRFMAEYESLGHMSLVPPEEVTHPKNPTYYIPHHFVLKESSTTTKLRVVFDGSAPSTSGKSLNDCMMVGPQLQDSLLDIMLRFRLHEIAYTADLEKMFRRFKVIEKDADMQRILWRPEPRLPIMEYRLNTVTYGTSYAPYVAVKCLQQLAKDERKNYPIASAVVLRDFFVDDLQSGSSTVEKAKQVVQQLINLCSAGGLQLRKWTSNSKELLKFIPEELKETKSVIPVEFDNSFSVKTLGVYWNTTEDTYYFLLSLPNDTPGKYTKRIILSEISKIYDPCGWLAPAIVVLKLFMQELWLLQAGWDELLPQTTQNKWIDLKSSLKDIEKLRIPRCVIPGTPELIMLCGYSDASLRAYSASVYVYAKFRNTVQTSHLLTSKTRVAPVKAVTLPRLELNGALLLSELMEKVIASLQITFHEVRAYTDSTIVLHWITSSPNRWKTYVRHRVQKIQDRIPTAKWFHVPGEVNPADCASRGISSLDMLTHPLWWSGGNYPWNHSENTMTPATAVITEDEATELEKEAASIQTFISKFNPRPLTEVLHRYSTFRKLERVIALMFRFKQNGVRKLTTTPKQLGDLTVTELQQAHTAIIREVQQSGFPTEYSALKKGKTVPTSSVLYNLKPFLCPEGLIRVGGRLGKADIPYDAKHPIMLLRSHVTSTIIRDIHLRDSHCGHTSVIATLQQRYWLTNIANPVKFILNRCVTCRRHQAKMMEQVMADLPYHRVNPSKPFSKVGIDYAGPFILRPMTRSKVKLKCWLSIFVCFATRAVHIEVVSSLTTDCFIAAFRRFISRRGRPSDIYSDCGTNFKGADRVFKEFHALSTDAAVVKECASQQIQWHFNPPGAPHFGGLWEAGVRSMKFHLVRVMGTSLLTYEEMLTLVCQIEGIMNSRPLIPASADPSDLQALTPAHFLVGTSLTALPEPSLLDLKENYLDRYQLIQKRQQLFWRRWTNEFISRLQHRPKWCKINRNLEVGDMVIVKDERLPPLKWKLGRVTSVHPGDDGHVRVATVRTADGVGRKPIVKLCHLPITQAEQ